MDKIRVAHYKVLTQKCLTDYYELVCAYHAGFCCSIFHQYHSDDDETSPLLCQILFYCTEPQICTWYSDM